MFVGVCRLVLHLVENNSLKGKRRIVRSVIDRTRAKFGVSIAEVGENDTLRRAVIGAAVIGNNGAHIDSVLNHLGAYIDRLGVAPVESFTTEIIALGDELAERGIDQPARNFNDLDVELASEFEEDDEW